MAKITLRPILRTEGGETSDIMWKNRYAGRVVLVYREQGVICGSVQLDKKLLSSKKKRKSVKHFITDYIQDCIHALEARECHIIVTRSSCDYIITAEEPHRQGIATAPYEDDQDQIIWVTDEAQLEDWDISDGDVYLSNRARRADSDYFHEPDNNYRNPAFYKLALTMDNRGKIEYHVYDRDHEWIAEIFLRMADNDLMGDIHWMMNPIQEEIEAVTSLLVSDFNDGFINRFSIDHLYENAVIDTIELTHHDLREIDVLPFHSLAEEAYLEDSTDQSDQLH